MSKAKYMSQRVDSSMSVIVYAEKLTAHLFQVTSNEKQFPKALRYSLSAEIRNTMLKFNEHLYMAAYIRPRKKKDYKLIQKHQRKAKDKLIAAKSLVTLSTNLANFRNLEYLAELYDDTVEAFNHWVRNTNRAYSKFLKKEAMSPEEREELAKIKYENRLSWMAKTMKHDADGFAVLTPRKSNKEELISISA